MDPPPFSNDIFYTMTTTEPGWVDRKELEEALIKARELSPKEVFMGKTIKLNGRDDNYETCRRIFKVAYDYISDNRISDVEACLGCDGVFFRRMR